MTRSRQRPEPLGEFSEWHRNKMPSWYKWIDADYVGYLDPQRHPNHAYEPYIVLELIHVRNRSKWGKNVNENYPLHSHKEEFYKALHEQLKLPVYIVWHPSECDEFVVRKLDEEHTAHLARAGFADLLDAHRKKAVANRGENQ
jgi:hypothetical protein